MDKKSFKTNLILVIFLVFFCINFAFSQNCDLLDYNQNCTKIINSQNIFKIINLSNFNQYANFNVKIYNLEKPGISIKVQKENFNINQIKNFLDSGIYKIKISLYDKAKNVKEKEFNFIYDNLNPAPPIINLNLKTTSNSLNITGFCQKQTQIIAKNIENNDQFTTKCNSNKNFSLIINNLENGANAFEFYTIKDKYYKSQILERIIYKNLPKEKPEFNIQEFNFENLEKINKNTYFDKKNNLYLTTKRNFLIKAKTNPKNAGKVIFIQGTKTIIDNKGNILNYVLLNQGLNKIEILSENLIKHINVKYINLNFAFTNFQTKKIVNKNSTQILIETNFPYQFLTLLNGQFNSIENPNQKTHKFTINNLKKGINYLEIRGINGEKIIETIYYDTQKPKIQNQNFQKEPTINQLIFKIEDDTGINIEKTNLQINNNKIDSTKLKVYGDFYIFDISQIEKNKELNYNLEVFDLAENKINFKNKININKNNSVIKKISSKNINQIGKNLFIKNQQIQIQIQTNQNLVFKNIFLDNKEQTNYKFISKNKILLNLNFSNKKQGILKFNLIDNNHKNINYTYNYFTNKNKPKTKINYIYYLENNSKAIIYGQINSSIINWKKLKIQNTNVFVKYGNHFEALIDLNQNNLKIEIIDLFNNAYIEEIGGIIYKDKTKSQINLGLNKDSNKFENFISGSISQKNTNSLNYIKSYDGFNFNSIYINSDKFLLPIQQRFGYRSLNLEGKENFGKKFSSYQKIYIKNQNQNNSNILIKNQNPKIYFTGNNIKTNSNTYFVQGQIIGFDKIKFVKIENGNCFFDQFTFICYKNNLKDGKNTFKIKCENIKGKTTTKTYNITKINNQYKLKIKNIFGKGIFKTNKKDNNYYLTQNLLNINSSISEEKLIKILIDSNQYFLKYKNQTFTIENLNISKNIKNFDEKQVNVQLVSKDEFSNIKFSNKIKLLYKRLFESFATIKIE